MFRIGVDIGGTFTDLVVSDGRDGKVHSFKSLTNVDPVVCLSAAMAKAAERLGITVGELLGNERTTFCFGSTIGVNALLTGSGGTVGIVTTKGHRDVYHMFNKQRLGIVDLRAAVEGVFQPLVPRRRVVEVNERVDSFGSVVVPLDIDEVRRAIEYLVDEEGVDALVVSFLWAHQNAQHEQLVSELARKLYPDLFVSVAGDLVPQQGEFRRVATAVVNAYIGRQVQQASRKVETYLRDAGLRTPIWVMQNLGGLAPLGDVGRRPVYLLKSAPVGGVMASQAIAGNGGPLNIIGMDMGGTSLDLSLITDGEVELTDGFRMRSHPIAIAGVAIESVGAGGGSIAAVDAAGGVSTLLVGPDSAGSDPGPACYGRGGSRPTVTDADLVLGLLDRGTPLGGEINLDLDRATEAIRTAIAGPLGIEPREAAWGIYQVITAEMSDAIEQLLVRRGLRPEDYTLMVFGAAGAVHASAIARRLGLTHVMIPRMFPVFSALGLMSADIRYVERRGETNLAIPVEPSTDLDERATTISQRLADTARAPKSSLESALRTTAGEPRLELMLGLHFAGQALDLPQGVRPSVLDEPLTGAELHALVDQWRTKYERIYGSHSAWSSDNVEVASYTAIAHSEIANPGGQELKNATGEAPAAAPTGQRPIYLGRELSVDVYDDSELAPTTRLFGPAVVQGSLRTVVLLEGDELYVDPEGDFHVYPGALDATSAS
jgi:N-methylhydantoinase A